MFTSLREPDASYYVVCLGDMECVEWPCVPPECLWSLLCAKHGLCGTMAWILDLQEESNTSDPCLRRRQGVWHWWPSISRASPRCTSASLAESLLEDSGHSDKLLVEQATLLGVGNWKCEGGRWGDEHCAQTVSIFLGNDLNCRELFNISNHTLAHSAKKASISQLMIN